MTEQPTPTVFSRLVDGGISADRVRAHFAAGRLTVDGVAVTGLDQPAPHPARITIQGDQ